MNNASVILDNIRTQNLGPVYVLEGEEPLYIDKIMKAFEEEALPPEARDFNQTTMYGNEVDWKQVITEARRMPMFGDRTLILLKEANQMKSLPELAVYLEEPNPHTTLVIEVKGKKIDRRSKFFKTVQKKANHFESPRIKDEMLAGWIQNYGKEISVLIPVQQAEMLAVYLGNDLQKIVNEIEKIQISEPGIPEITPAIIEKYIGISREYNIFELIDAFFAGQQARISSIINYFSANPKNLPLPLMIASFYGFISKAFLSFYISGFNEQRQYGIWDKHLAFGKKYGMAKVHQLIQLLQEYAQKAVGMGIKVSSPAMILKEMLGRMQVILK